MSAHVDDLFSEAYDRLLRGAERERFDDHLAACTQCHDAYAAYRASIDALRALPQARMPFPVHLPDSPPVAARPSLWERLAGSGRRLQVSVATAAVAIVAALAGTAVLTAGHTASTALQAPQAATASGSQRNAAGQGLSADGAAPLPTAAPHPAIPEGALTTCGTQTLTSSAGTPATTLSGGPFATRTVVDDPAVPGRTLTLATTASTVAPGGAITVYARFGGASGSAQILPCVVLTSAQVPVAATPGSEFAPAPQAPSGAGAGAQDYALTVTTQAPFSIARPTFAADSGMTLQTVTIPAPLRPGSRVELVATIPAGSDPTRTTPLTAVLVLTIG